MDGACHRSFLLPAMRLLFVASCLLLVRRVATAGGSSMAVADIRSTRNPRWPDSRTDGSVFTAVLRARRLDIYSTDKRVQQ